jgi:amino acid permease
MTDDGLFTRDEVLGGLPARKANTLMFLIECRTAQFISLSQQATGDFYTEKSSQEENLAFLEAFTLGRQLPLRPSIQDLERYAFQWGHLVPDNNAKVQAAIAHLFGQKYRFTTQRIPNIRAVLGIENSAVQAAYQRLYREPIKTIFQSQLGLAEEFRWIASSFAYRFESLPPFWIAFAFTVTANFSQGVLALPIAIAGIGTIPGLAILGIIGLLNILTIACMAESVARSAVIRYGNAFLGRLVTDYLGRSASMVLTAAVVLLGFLGLLAASVGISVTLSQFTGLLAPVWALGLMAVVVIRLWREGRKFGVVTLMILGTISVSLIGVLGLLALPHLQPANLVANPFAQPDTLKDFNPSVLASVLGGILVGFQGSSRVPHCAKMLLPRDPSGRSLIWGSIAGTIATLVFFMFWVVAVNGTVPASELMDRKGTALDPLLTVVGPVVSVLGSIAVCLLLGLAAFRTSDLLFNLVRERLPNPSPAHIILNLVRQGKTNLRDLAEAIGEDEKTVKEVLEKLAEAGLISAPEPPPADDFSQLAGGKRRSPRSSLMPDIGDASSEPNAPKPEAPPPKRTTQSRSSFQWKAFLSSSQGRFLTCILPVIGVFFITEWLLVTGAGSFSRILSVIGVLSVSLISGIFPVLLLASSRRKGEVVPQTSFQFLSHPLCTVSIYALFLLNVLLHGFVIWQGTIERVAAVSTGIAVIVVTILMIRQGAFRPRLVIELRDDQRKGESAAFSITACGQPTPMQLQLTYPRNEQHVFSASDSIQNFEKLSSVQVDLSNLPMKNLKELKVWVHSVTTDGDSRALAAIAHISCDDQSRQFDLKSMGGQLIVPLVNPTQSLKVQFSNRSLL